MRKIIALASLIAAASTAPAHAWGEREQGIVTGIVGTIAIQQLFRPVVPVYPGTIPPVVVPQYAPPVVPVVPYYPGTVYPDYIYRAPRPMYRGVDVYIPECNCYRTIMMRVN